MKIYLKAINDGLWEKNPHITTGIVMILGLIIFFSVLFLDISF